MVDQVRVDTCRGLLDGYGVEDIAVIYGHKTEDVRSVLAKLRLEDVLSSIIRQAGERHVRRKAGKV